MYQDNSEDGFHFTWLNYDICQAGPRPAVIFPRFLSILVGAVNLLQWSTTARAHRGVESCMRSLSLRAANVAKVRFDRDVFSLLLSRGIDVASWVIPDSGPKSGGPLCI